MRISASVGVGLIGCVCSAALAQTPVRDGPFQKLVLDSFQDAKAWGVAEATVEPDTQRVKAGASSLHFGIDVNWKTGEKNYPIGWPRTNRAFDEPWQRDWTGYDFFRFYVYTTASRDTLPNEPLGLILYTPDKPSAYHRTLRELQKDQWVEIKIPIGDVPRCNEVTRIQFFISESRYRDGDRVDFYISDLALLRYAEPTLDDFGVGQRVMFADSRFLPVRARTFGIAPDARTPLELTVTRGGRVVAQVTREVGRGEATLWLDLGRKPLPAGECEVRAALRGSKTAPKTDIFRVVVSPWQ